MSVHEDLIRKHLDGLATDEDQKALERLLFESPVAADTFARVLLGSGDLPVGVVTAFLGAPFFLYLLAQRRRVMG